MWAAHALTLARLPIAIAIVAAYGHPAVAIALVALAALTDAADGRVARWMQRRGQTRPDIGGWLDPLVDKLFVVIVLAAYVAHAGSVIVVALIAAREVVVVPLAVIHLVRHRPIATIHAAPIGKAATIAQLVAIGIVLAVPATAAAVWPAAAIAGVLGVAAAAHYVVVEATS